MLLASSPVSIEPLTSTASTATDDTDSDSSSETDEEEEDAVEIRIEAQELNYPEKLSQSTVDSIVGGSGRFLQLVGNETGYNSQHMLTLNTTFLPRSDYGRTIYRFGIWTYQNAVDYVVEDGGIVILPHFFDRDIATGASMVLSLWNYTALEIMSGGRGSASSETRAEFNAWNAVNANGLQRIFAVMSSNNTTKEQVGTRYISGLMGRLTEENVYEMIRSGNYIATNGPTVRFELGGIEMGGTATVPMVEDEAASAASGETVYQKYPVQAKIYACDDSPLTTVQLIRYEIKSSIEDPTPEYIFEIDLTGQNVYEYSEVLDIEVGPEEFYRLEARSEQDDAYDDVGVGLSNPIWIYGSNESSQTLVSASGFELKLKGEVVETANNRWALKDINNFIPMLFSADTNAAYTSVAYHERDSVNFPDSVTIYMLAPDGKTNATETLYILD
ncbi:MAG: hypothetical protein Q4B42_01620 [Oscillospiraceae bacterium]|nr:hypothetical protein [Oscillospiraceae bacterium]